MDDDGWGNLYENHSKLRLIYNHMLKSIEMKLLGPYIDIEGG